MDYSIKAAAIQDIVSTTCAFEGVPLTKKLMEEINVEAAHPYFWCYQHFCLDAIRRAFRRAHKLPDKGRSWSSVEMAKLRAECRAVAKKYGVDV